MGMSKIAELYDKTQTAKRRLFELREEAGEVHDAIDRERMEHIIKVHEVDVEKCHEEFEDAWKNNTK